uniref:separase n=1 Tax=Globodera pallida TaxID=36090 RepID=A0A183CI92_GLOPA
MASAASTAPITQTAAFKKCRRMISIYIVSLARVQDEMFAEYGESDSSRQFFDDDFYDPTSLECHQRLCAQFAKCHTKPMAPDVEELITAWRNIVSSSAVTTGRLDGPSMDACVILIKYIISFCLLEARFYEALECLCELVLFAKGADFSAWLLAVLWTIRLEEWTILERILAAERAASARRPSLSDSYCLVMHCARLIQRLHSSQSATEQHQCAAEATTLLHKLSADSAKRTFLSMQARVLLRALLSRASRVPKADLQKVDDPLVNRELELGSLRGILNSRHPEFFQSNQSSSIRTKVTNADEFMRLCSAFAEYQEAAHIYTWELLEVGQIREAEATSITFWRDNLAFGVPFWTLRPLAQLFHIKSLTGIESLDGYANCLNALLTPLTASRSRYLHTPRKPIRPSSYRRGSAVDDSFERRLMTSTLDAGGSLDALLALELSSVNLHQDDEEERNRQFRLEAHVADCVCAFCTASGNNWMFAQQCHWVSLLFGRHLPDKFAQFRHQMQAVREEKARPLRNRVLQLVFLHSVFSEEFYKNDVGPPKRKRGRQPTRRMLADVKEDNNSSEKENMVDESSKEMFRLAKLQSSIHHSDELFVRTCSRLLVTRWTELGSVDECKAHIREPFELCKQSPLTLRAHWLLLKHLARKCSSSTARMDLLKSAYEDQKNYGHLLFSEWRRRNCFFLARCFGAQQLSQWHRALYLLEAGTPALRQLARTSAHKKQLKQQQQHRQQNRTDSSTEEQSSMAATTSTQKQLTNTFIFDNSAHFQARIGRLPENLTLVNLTLEEDGTLTLTRCNAAHEPIVVPICRLKKPDPVLERMRELLMASDESVRTSGTDSVQFWIMRKQLDKEMENFIDFFQSSWFAASAPLLLPLPLNTENALARHLGELTRLERTFVAEHGMATASALTLARLLPFVETLDEWLALGKLLHLNDKHHHQPGGGGLNNVDDDGDDAETTMTKTPAAVPDKFIRFLSLCWTNLRVKTGGKGNKKSTTMTKQYTMLVIPPSLSHLPWECLPIYQRAPLVYRIPCFHLFEHLMERIKNIPTSVDGRNSYYVLNPGGDLAKTQERISTFIERFKWRGIVGQIPSKEQIRTVLNEHDLFLYMGHGSGGRYFGRSMIRESECRAVSVLMGCSSVRVVDEGPDLDGRSAVYEYMIARAPCVIGCLWMVTDGEIDRFFMALTEYCFAELHKKDVGTVSDTFRLLLEGVLEARRKCKLPFLTGAAVVAYGLPVVAALSAIVNNNSLSSSSSSSLSPLSS